MTDSPPATAAGRGSIAYEPCPQDGHSHDWRDCPTPEDWATTTAATEKAAYRAVLVAVIGAGALVVLALLVGVCWAIDRVLGGWFLLADIVIAAPLALWWQIRAMRANGFPLPWEERP